MLVFQEYNKLFAGFGDKSFDLEYVQRWGLSKDIPRQNLVLMKQTHSKEIMEVDEKHLGSGFTKDALETVDAIATNKKNIFLLIKTADCAPILIYDPKREVVCAIHSGKVGTEKGILSASLEFLKKRFGCVYDELKVAIGPCISGRSYTAQKQEFDRFVANTKVNQDFPNISIRKVLSKNLKDAKIKKSNITLIPICTLEDDSYNSFRENKTAKRQISFIGMLP